MKNGLDFHRILDSNGKLIGVLDFNNMIPVRPNVVKKIQARIEKSDDQATRKYKELMSDQLTFCRQNHDVIVNKANKLYRMVHQKNTSNFIKRRCLNWTKLEEILDRFQPKPKHKYVILLTTLLLFRSDMLPEPFFIFPKVHPCLRSDRRQIPYCSPHPGV